MHCLIRAGFIFVFVLEQVLLNAACHHALPSYLALDYLLLLPCNYVLVSCVTSSCCSLFFLFLFPLVSFSLPCLAFVLFGSSLSSFSSSSPLTVFCCLFHSICQTADPKVNTVPCINIALLLPTSSSLFSSFLFLIPVNFFFACFKLLLHLLFHLPHHLPCSSSYAELGAGRSSRGQHRAGQGHVAEGHLGTAPLGALLACLGCAGDD